jgi:DNA-binding LacI/PurR family transcriptional regulator
MGSGKTTSFDIAHRAGVSQATVSRALRNSPLVNAKTRERIQRIALEMNYRVDRSAAGLRSQQSRTIALLIYEDPTTDDSQINPFFLSMLGNITRVAATRGYDVLVSFQQLSNDWLNEYQVSNRADGLILLGYGDYGGTADKLQRLIDGGAHFTIWGATVPELEGHAVGCDNIAGGQLATRHLLALDRRKIAFIGRITDDAPEFKQRYEGYCAALREAGIEPDPQMQIDVVNHEALGFSAMERLLANRLPFDAVFAASDLLAFGAIRCLRINGVKVPEDVSIVGCDDVSAASYFSPSLTTIRQDTGEAANALVGNLLAMIDGEPVQSGLLGMSLIVRGSCGGRSS